MVFLCVGIHGQGYNYGSPLDQLPVAGSSISEVVEADPLEILATNIPGDGVPGEDYPILSSTNIPDTGFSCEAQGLPGYFADTAEEAGCQVFHICQDDGTQDSFLCPNGTVFNQMFFVCDWWFNVDCAASDQFFNLNLEIGKVPEAEAEEVTDASPESQVEELIPAASNVVANTPHGQYNYDIATDNVAYYNYESEKQKDLSNGNSINALLANPPNGLYDTPTNDYFRASSSDSIPDGVYKAHNANGEPTTDFLIQSPPTGSKLISFRLTK